VATLTVLTQPPPTLKHKYTFNMPAGPTVVTDVVGGKDGVVVGNGAYNGTGRLLLDGATAYVNLPNDLVTSFNSITIEAWVQDDGSAGWARIFDFGNSTGGEDFTIGAGTQGTQYMFLSAPSGFGNLRGAYTLTGGGAGEQLLEQTAGSLPVGQLKHVVWTTSGAAKAGRLYVDGALIAENRSMTITPAAMGPTVNNWLGRSQWPDPLFKGQFEEFTIWNGFMLAPQIAASFAAGPTTDLVRPRLSISNQSGDIVISWPDWTAAYNLVLESATSLKPSNWQAATVNIIQEDGQFKATVIVGETAQFFRLAP
jgi:hypothetical protein